MSVMRDFNVHKLTEHIKIIPVAYSTLGDEIRHFINHIHD